MALHLDLTLTLVGAADEPTIFDTSVQRGFSAVQSALQDIDLKLEVGMRVHSSAGGTGRIWQTGDYVVHAFHRSRAGEIADAVRGYLEAHTGRLVRLGFENGSNWTEAARAEDVAHILSAHPPPGRD